MSQKLFQDISKEQIEAVIQLFNPHMEDYLYIMDIEHDYYRISKHAVDRFMLPSDSFYDAVNAHNLFVYEDDRAMLAEDLAEIVQGKKKSHNLHYRWIDKSGTPVWINCRGQVVEGADGIPRYLIGCINETGKKQRADNTSGLLGEQELSSFIRSVGNQPVSGFLMRFDIDDFSSINSTCGMDFGDYVLNKVAGCISGCLTEQQHLFHVVSDEYMVVDFSSHTTKDAVSLYKEVRKSIRAFIDSEKYKSVFTISAGILGINNQVADYANYMEYSEFALKQTKNHGKNSYYIFNETDYETFLRKRRITMALHHAVSHDFEGFDVHYQPIVDCNTYEILGAEALMRFSIPDKEGNKSEVISPFEFIPLLEESGLILPAGNWILDRSIATCSELQQYIPEFRMNINISYVQVMKGNILKEILSAATRYQLNPKYIGIEITESGYLDSNPHFLKLWDGIKKNGVTLILDDFGTGYSNLHCLSNLNPTYIKLDKDFTNKAMRNLYDHELMVKIIEMAHILNLKICVEGVEEKEVLAELQKINADYIQGYLFGKPYCKDEFCEKFL